MNIREQILKLLRQSTESFTSSEANSIVERIAAKLCIDEYVDISSNTQKVKLVSEMVDNVVAIKRTERLRLERSKQKHYQDPKKQAKAISRIEAERLARHHRRLEPYTGQNFGERGDYEADIPVVARLNDRDMQEAILQYLMNANLKARPLPSTQEADVAVSSNQEFWDLVKAKQRRIGLKWIKLDGFSLLDWFPRSPGLYYTDFARDARYEARNYLRVQEDCLVYEPEGKVHMINGGVGSLRFKPTRILNEDCWLCTATSDSYCHTGVPLAIPDKLFQDWDYDYENVFEIIGQIRYVPELLEEYYSHMNRIPQFYILAESIKRLEIQRNSPCLISPLVFFFSVSRSDKYATFVNCSVKEDSQISEAADWIARYVERYSGEVLTNFDQQQPQFRNAPFALEKLMNGQITIHDVGRLDIGRANLVCKTVQKIQSMELIMGNSIHQYGSGDNVAGDKVMGDKIGTQINNSQDLAQASKDIKALLDQLSVDYPSDSSRVLGAKAVDEVEKNPELKSRILRGVKAGSFAALEKMIDHPVAKFFIEGAKEVLKP